MARITKPKKWLIILSAVIVLASLFALYYRNSGYCVCAPPPFNPDTTSCTYESQMLPATVRSISMIDDTATHIEVTVRCPDSIVHSFVFEKNEPTKPVNKLTLLESNIREGDSIQCFYSKRQHGNCDQEKFSLSWRKFGHNYQAY